jgi:LysR family transcriptional regulator, nod-box dependent transcriptional activator
MRLHEFDLNLLLYLDALLAEQGVSKAAVRVHISQPAMSLSLLRLRKLFGDELLVSVIGRKMVLTPLAQSLISPVREAILKIQSIPMTIPAFDPATSTRKFSIMASGYATDVLLNRLMSSLSLDAPGIRVELRRLTSDDRQQIRRADLDLLIAPKKMMFEELPTEKLWQDEPVCIVWSKNSLVGKEISVGQYARMGHVCVMLDGHTPCQLDMSFLDQFGTRRVEVVVPEMSMIPRAIEGTQRIAVVYSRLAQLYAKQCSLRLVKPPTDFPPLSECMQWHPLEDLDPELAWFRKYVRGAVKTFELNSAVGAMVQHKDCGSFNHRSLGMANIRRIQPA